MQVPRGTFLSLRKNVLLSSILEETAATKFSGYCVASTGDESFSFVIKAGSIVLASHRNLSGDAAVEAAIRAHGALVNAIFSALTPSQITLAIEFNKHATVKKSDGIFSPGKGTPVSLAERGGYNVPLSRTEPLNQKIPLAGSGQGSLQGSPRHLPVSQAVSGPEEEIPDDALYIRDFENLDRLDLDTLAMKIRTSCRLTVESLDLGHLIAESDR
jgi:hypothetical protein